MQKFEKSCGLPNNQIQIIKYNIKNKIFHKLPILPEPVEMKLFFEGRDAWILSWSLLNKKYPIQSTDKISLEVVVKLKKEFYRYQETTHYKFLSDVELTGDIYSPRCQLKQSKGPLIL